MAVYLYSVGVAQGTLVGTFGVLFYCMLISGLRGMPGWVLANIIIGIMLGTVMKLTKDFRVSYKMIILVLTSIVSVGIGILGVKSGVECVLYGQPFLLRTANNIYAFVADVVTLTFCLPLCFAMESKIKRSEVQRGLS